MKSSLLLILFCIGLSVSAQEKTSTDKETKFSVGAYYQNDLQYLGRKDSIKSPLIVPNLRLALKNGLFTEVEAYVDAKSGKLDGGYGAVGYEFNQEKWGGGISLSQYVFDKTSTFVKADLGTSLETSAYYNLGVLTANIEPVFIFGKDGGFILGTGVSKDIDLDSESHFQISPKLYSWFGNQSFAEEHYITSQIQHGHSPKVVSTTSVTTTDVNKFQLMDIEASMAVSYVWNKFKIFGEPLVAIPENYKSLGGYYASSQYPNPIFIIKLGANYTF